MSSNKNFDKNVGMGIRELTILENSTLCSLERNQRNMSRPPILNRDISLNYTLRNNFEIRIYSSGCYYFDRKMSSVRYYFALFQMAH